MNTYLTIRDFTNMNNGKPATAFRVFRHVSHTEAIGILDSFQRHDGIVLDGVDQAINHYLTFGEEV